MPRPKLPKTQKLSEITFVKLLQSERRELDRIHRERKRSKHPRRSRSAILREAWQFYLDHQLIAAHWDEDRKQA